MKRILFFLLLLQPLSFSLVYSQDCHIDGIYYNIITQEDGSKAASVTNAIGGKDINFDSTTKYVGDIVIPRHNYVPCIIKFDSQTHIIQNTSFDFDAYYTGAPLSVGYDITDTINYGNVIVKSGHKLTIERRQNVTIKNGFSVEPGATFQIK